MQAAAVTGRGTGQLPPDLESQATYHLFICQTEGFSALKPLIVQSASSARALLVVGRADSVDMESACLCPPEQATTEISAALVQAPLATAIYVAGSETFRKDVQNQARTLGFAEGQIRVFTPESVLRRVFCTHCYTTTEYDRHGQVTCRNCKRPLMVRDRYSRYLGAYVGIHADRKQLAEESLSRANTG